MSVLRHSFHTIRYLRPFPKGIENTQRDVNILLVNELAMFFNRLGIDTQEMVEAAGSKRNFLPFRPGLVGGHCIGVDPYYLTHKAQAIGRHHPELILAGRRLNDGAGLTMQGNTSSEITCKDEVYAIIEAAFEVYNTLCHGFLEAVYQEALAIELAFRRIPFRQQEPISVTYKVAIGIPVTQDPRTDPDLIR